MLELIVMFHLSSKAFGLLNEIVQDKKFQEAMLPFIINDSKKNNKIHHVDDEKGD